MCIRVTTRPGITIAQARYAAKLKIKRRNAQFKRMYCTSCDNSIACVHGDGIRPTYTCEYFRWAPMPKQPIHGLCPQASLPVLDMHACDECECLAWMPGADQLLFITMGYPWLWNNGGRTMEGAISRQHILIWPCNNVLQLKHTCWK